MMHQMAAVAGGGASMATIPFDLLRPFFESMAAAAKIAWNPYFHNPKLPKRLHRVSAPTLVIAGRLDGLVPCATSEEYARLIDGAKLEIWDDASHMIPLEQPARLAARVSDHITTATVSVAG
jgi:pimeloyl-ACP methyl ester carboxylesterase